MGRQRQRRVKRAREPLELGVWSAWGRRLRDPGNGWAPAAAEGEGQGWEKPWAGGRGIPGEGGEGRGTGCQGPADGSLPHRERRAGAQARRPGSPSPSGQSLRDLLSEPSAFPPPTRPPLPPAPPLAPRRHAPSLFSCEAPPPPPAHRGLLPSPSPPGESPAPNPGSPAPI